MTVLVNASVNIPSGSHDFGPFATTTKAALIEMDGTVFPAGTTTIALLFSFDGGTTFPNSVSGTYIGPTIPKVPTYRLSFELATQPDHVKATTIAPSAFTTQVTLSTL